MSSRPAAHRPAKIGRPVRWRAALRVLARRSVTGLALALGLAGGTVLAQDTRFFRIGTGSPGASYFPIGGLIASAISNPPGSRPCDQGGSCGVPGLIAVAQTTRGSIENVEAIRSGTFESGLTQSDVAYWAYTGTSVFGKSGPVKNLRAIANLYQESLHIVVRAHAGIASIADLKGKRVSLGEKGSGTLVTARLVLEAYGLGEKRIKPAYLPVGEAGDRLRAGTLDAIMIVSGYPVPAIADLAAAAPIALLAVEGETAAALRIKYPFFAVDIIPMDAYNTAANTITLGIGALWVVAAELDDDLVYGITKALWHKNTRKLLDQGSPIGRQIRVDTALAGLPIPLHPGAARYYGEIETVPAPPAGQ